MKKVLKLTVIIISVLLIASLATLFSLSNTLSKRFAKKYKPNTTKIIIPADSASIRRGNILTTALCTNCHGSDLGGIEIFNKPRVGIIYSRNITPGGETKNFSDADWINAIRFGVREDGTPLFVMPSKDDYNKMSDDDLGCMIAYLKTIKPSDKNWPLNAHGLTFYGKIFMQTGGLGHSIFSAEKIDMNDNSPRTSPAKKETAEYGGYLVSLSDCKYCHGPELNGGVDTGTTDPPAPNITPGGNLGNWNMEQFIKTIRLGVTPSGKHLNPGYMPWTSIAAFQDTELKAIYAFLKSQPALKDSKR